MCHHIEASSQRVNRKPGDASDEKGEPDLPYLTSGSEQMKNPVKWSLRKQQQIQQQNTTLMLPQQT